MGPRSRSRSRSHSVGSRSVNFRRGGYDDDPADEDDEQLFDDEDQFNDEGEDDELDDDDEYDGYRQGMSRSGMMRGGSDMMGRSRSLSRSRMQGRGMMSRMQSPYSQRQSPYGRDMMESGMGGGMGGYDDMDDEEELMSERGRGSMGGGDMYSPRFQGQRYGGSMGRSRYGGRMQGSPYLPRYARDDMALYHGDEMSPYGPYSPAAAAAAAAAAATAMGAAGGYRGGSPYGPSYSNYMDYMPTRKYYDDLDIVPWGSNAGMGHSYWAGATMSTRRLLPPLPGATPNLAYPTPHAFAVQLGSLAGASGPWFSFIDEMDHRRLLFATGACTTGISVITLVDDVTGELLRLTSCRTGRSVGCADVRIVVMNRFGAPLITAIVPAVTETCERSYYGLYGAGGYGGGGMYGGGGGAFGSAMSVASTAAAAAATAAAARRGYATAGGMSPFSGVGSTGGWYGGSPYGFDADATFYPYGGMSEYGAGDASMGAVYYVGDRGHEGPSLHRRRKRTMPAMRLVRSPDGTREWVQTGFGEELASVVYSTPPGTPAPFAVEGSQSRVVVRPGIDVTLVAAALVARLWIYVETGVGQ